MAANFKGLAAAALLAGVFSFCASALDEAAEAAGCRFSPVRLSPAEAAKYDTYVGKGKTLDLVLSNATGKPADTFSDPLHIRNHDGQGGCAIDGGNWTANGFYLSPDDKVLLALEFSGSSSELAIYETATCARKAAFDVSSAKWVVTGGAIMIAAHYVDEARKKRVPKKTIRFGTNCLPR
jgi:hypothetical protein